MKILKQGRLSIHDNSKWIPDKWREEPNAPADDQPCGIGFHSLIRGDPLKAPVFFFPCEVWEDECQGECGKDEIKARYKRQRIIKEITDQFPIIVAINEFITKTIPSIKWFIPQTPEPWMEVVDYEDLAAAGAAAWTEARAAARGAARAAAWTAAGEAAWEAAGAAAWTAARAAARGAAWDAARDAARAAARGAAWDAARDAARAAERGAAWDAARDAAWDAAWDAAGAAAGDVYAILIHDLGVDTTWLTRWWRAWELGYYPIKEDGDKLIVGKIKSFCA
ncbi:MAG: hypothetical protein MUO24_02265 [Desulfobacterales bacterium]|nr:hypothetical protein [Desulfobacterales bacterium]